MASAAHWLSMYAASAIETPPSPSRGRIKVASDAVRSRSQSLVRAAWSLLTSTTPPTVPE